MAADEMPAPVRADAVELWVHDIQTRVPFRYGIATLTGVPYVLVRLRLESEAGAAWGVAADMLPPKWFRKDPDQPPADELAELAGVVRHAADLADGSAGESLFDWWKRLYDRQHGWGNAEGLPPLLSGFGASLMERAAIDAWCRVQGTTFAEAVRAGGMGIDLTRIDTALEGVTPADVLPDRPLRSLAIRHTVGLGDPITAGDLAPGEHVRDGLPHTLEEVVRAYGVTHLKIKLPPDPAEAVDRLRAIAAVPCPAAAGFRFSLDGNECYRDVAGFREAWGRVTGDDALAGFLRGLLFIEQPLHRDVAVGDEVAAAMRAWAGRPPIIIDESDGDLTALPRALEAGYAGTSHKNCKGVFRSIAAAARLRQAEAEHGRPAVHAAEDLCTVGPVALPQDLAVVATLGIPHVERNGHHYFRGLSMFAEPLQRQLLERHADLYREHPDGFATLAVDRGRVSVGSVVDAPFGVGFRPDLTGWRPLASWSPG